MTLANVRKMPLDVIRQRGNHTPPNARHAPEEATAQQVIARNRKNASVTGIPTLDIGARPFV